VKIIVFHFLECLFHNVPDIKVRIIFGISKLEEMKK